MQFTYIMLFWKTRPSSSFGANFKMQLITEGEAVPNQRS